jgi:hypothetical protein
MTRLAFGVAGHVPQGPSQQRPALAELLGLAAIPDGPAQVPDTDIQVLGQLALQVRNPSWPPVHSPSRGSVQDGRRFWPVAFTPAAHEKGLVGPPAACAGRMGEGCQVLAAADFLESCCASASSSAIYELSVQQAENCENGNLHCENSRSEGRTFKNRLRR